jgi:hypothetical protein
LKTEADILRILRRNKISAVVKIPFRSAIEARREAQNGLGRKTHGKIKLNALEAHYGAKARKRQEKTVHQRNTCVFSRYVVKMQCLPPSKPLENNAKNPLTDRFFYDNIVLS